MKVLNYLNKMSKNQHKGEHRIQEKASTESDQKFHHSFQSPYEVEGWDHEPGERKLVPDPEKNHLMNMMIEKYQEIIHGNSPSPYKSNKYNKSPFEESKFCSPINSEDNFNILRIINENQSKQMKQNEVKCIIEDPGEEDFEIEDTCNSDIAKIPERFSQSVIIPVTETERFFLDEKSDGIKPRRGGHKRMESRSFDKSTINKIKGINLDAVLTANKSFKGNKVF